MFDISKHLARLRQVVMGWIPSRRVPAPKPRRRLLLEPLSDRVLLSACILNAAYYTTQPPANATAQIVAALKSGGDHQDANSADPAVQQLLTSIRQAAAQAGGFGEPVVSFGETTVDGVVVPTVRIDFGSTYQINVTIRPDPAAPDSGGASRPGSYDMGVAVQVHTPEGDQHFVLESNDRALKEFFDARQALPSLLIDDHGLSTDAKSRERAVGGDAPSVTGSSRQGEGTAALETTADGAGAFPPGKTDGARIARALADEETDGPADPAAASANGDRIDRGDPGDSAAALLTVDWKFPDAREELVTLRNAGLAVIPVYDVGAPPTATAPDGRPGGGQECSLAEVVIGLDETAAARSSPAAVDLLFQRWPPDQGYSYLAADAAPLAGEPEPVGAKADSSPGLNALPLRQQLDDLFKPDAKKAAAVALVVDALIAVGLRRLAQSDVKGVQRPKK